MAALAHACTLRPAGQAQQQRQQQLPPLPPAAAAASRRHCPSPWPVAAARRPLQPPASTAGFHQSLLAATERAGAPAAPLTALAVREAGPDAELEAAAWLRALSFYRYPKERAFAAQVHRTMVAEEEVKALKAARLNHKLDSATTGERFACLVALCPAAQLEPSEDEPLDERLLLQGGGGHAGSGSHASSGGMQERAAAAALAAAEAAGEPLALVGTLDLFAVRALSGEVLVGDSRNAAYLANVCTATAARRRGVGQALLATARDQACRWGVDALYVHTMAVNEIAVRFYERNGFVVEKEESSNQAHYRGRCLDGIEGRGRTVLLRDMRLHG